MSQTNRGTDLPEFMNDLDGSVMHVNPGGRMSVFPENQHQMFGKKGELNTNPQDQE